jgi:predicted nucleic acid-binding protein
MMVVANTTPVISLACIGRLDILERLFGMIVVAEAVDQDALQLAGEWQPNPHENRT